ncbi:glycosyltransferase family 4 protein [Paenibacillus silviterrae]|uniref:glycosyltransferase family 4 protein n=1 Tax=Paenibacillus silviterrae TaxID=3242194 RepID=UPI002543121E|nr:glycosyltransferase family 4 protein [Paenibacillus chinjuensis]
MKIVQISTNSLPVPPKDYGGTQRDVYYLTEELVRRGHEVILFAKKGSNTLATATYEYPSNSRKEQLKFIMRHMPKDVDIIHDHYGIVSKASPPIPTIRNSHSKAVRGVQLPVYVSKTILKKYGKNKGYYVHNGIRLSDYVFRETKQDYLLFLGRIMNPKGVHLAIEVAKKTGKQLIIAGTLNNNTMYKEYFRKRIKPHLNDQISFVGPVGGKMKQELISQASVVLFPSTWDEPFGLVLIEAMACGTPVLGFKKAGAVPEVLKGMPQLLCDDAADMADKVKSREELPSAQECRAYVDKYFSDKVMTDNFLDLYNKVIDEKLYKIKRNTGWIKLKKAMRKKPIRRKAGR